MPWPGPGCAMTGVFKGNGETKGVPTDLPPDREGEAKDRVGCPEGVQVKAFKRHYAFKRVFSFSRGWGVGPEIVDFGPLPGPTQPRGALGKAPFGAPLDLHRFSAP